MGLFDMFRRPKAKRGGGGSSPAVKQRQAVVTRPEDWRPGQILLNDFVIERELGEGGMGKVYLMKSQTTGMRFAVKRAKGLGQRERRNFLAELQIWIDLPEHPNLVPCRFFRTVGDEVLIFAEYVEGGNLKSWIDSRKLYYGGPEKTLERILDAAIQSAWALHCLHELGLVHQDVKPANVMMDKDAQAAVEGLKVRVTDYGLARARAASGERHAAEDGQSILVSSGGYTPAYCSPEQADGRKLDRRTDVWSWGVSVMEMFHGGVSWHSGRVAAQALETFLENNGREKHIPLMPNDVVELLAKCFREDPAQRWQSLEAVVQKLKGVYRATIGAEYPRTLGEIENRIAPQARAGERRTHEGLPWRDPREWLERALRAEGRDPGEAAAIVARHASSHRGQLVADVAAYDEARRIYERLIRDGGKDLAYDLSILCLNAALVHEKTDDFSGAMSLYDRAIEILEQLIHVGRRGELIGVLISVYEQKANTLMNTGDNRAAIGLYDRAIQIRERLVDVKGLSNHLGDGYSIYTNKAVALMKLGESRAAVALYDRAIKILERLVNVEGRRELANDLAGLYINKAIAIGTFDQRSAVGLYDQAIRIRERLVNVDGRREFAQGLAVLYMNKANIVGNLGDNRTAVTLFDRAIEILEPLITIDGRLEFANDLAGLYMNKGVALKDLGDTEAAVALYDRAIEIREWLVNMDGRRDLANGLAKLYVNKANAVMDLGDQTAVVALYDRAIEILERLVNVEGRRELADNLAMAYMNKANGFMILGDNSAALAPYDRAIEILQRLVNTEGRRELAGTLAKLYRNKGNAVKNLGNSRAAVALYDRAIEALNQPVNVEEARELIEAIADLRVKSITEQS
jgi:serine/threonine protein kinase/lipopolysaccharide biosynthesis regulator YciM